MVFHNFGQRFFENSNEIYERRRTDEESSEAILNATTHADVRTIFVELLGEVKKMNENQFHEHILC